MPQFGIPCPVRATKVTDPSDVHVFNSLSLAQAQIVSWTGTKPHHTTIRRHAERGAEAHGYRWEIVTNNNGTVAQVDDEFTGIPDTSIFTFRDCIESIFNGGKVRVTDETPRRASVLDIIRIVSNNTSNPRQRWQQIRESAEGQEVVTKCYDWKFPGAGQRDTPVTDAEGIMLLINILPGSKAQQFRASAMHTLIRVMVGDQSLHTEIDDNATRQAQLPADHPLHMMSDEVYAHPRSSKYVLLSPNMKGKYIGSLYNRSVVYLLVFMHENQTYIKIGWSDEFRGRMDSHFIELPGCRIYSVFPIDNAYRVEQAWKNDFRAYCSPITINGKKKTELYLGITLEEAEGRLIELCQEQKCVHTKDHEYEMMELRMKHELALRDKDLAMKDKDLESQRLSLQILQAQLSLRS